MTFLNVQDGDMRGREWDTEDIETMRAWKRRQADMDTQGVEQESEQRRPDFTDSPSHSRYWKRLVWSWCSKQESGLSFTHLPLL